MFAQRTIVTGVAFVLLLAMGVLFPAGPVFAQDDDEEGDEDE